jgi:hypothetical protein
MAGPNHVPSKLRTDQACHLSFELFGLGPPTFTGALIVLAIQRAEEAGCAPNIWSGSLEALRVSSCAAKRAICPEGTSVRHRDRLVETAGPVCFNHRASLAQKRPAG